MFQRYKLLYYNENPAIYEMILVVMSNIVLHVLLSVLEAGSYNQPPTVFYLEPFLHLHMLIKPIYSKNNFPFLLKGPIHFNFKSFFYFNRTVCKQTVKTLIRGISKGSDGRVDRVGI